MNNKTEKKWETLFKKKTSFTIKKNHKSAIELSE